MGLFSKKTENPAVAEYKAAKRDLNERFNNPQTSADDPGYLAANQRVADAEKHVSWWRR